MRRHIALVLIAWVSLAIMVVPTAAAARDGHWIGVRQRDGELELFDRRTGGTFVPRGANMYKKVREGGEFASTLFRPGDWDPRWVRRQLELMAGYGYNTANVLIDACRHDCISTSRAGLRG